MFVDTIYIVIQYRVYFVIGLYLIRTLLTGILDWRPGFDSQWGQTFQNGLSLALSYKNILCTAANSIEGIGGAAFYSFHLAVTCFS